MSPVEWPRERITADVKIQNVPLRRCAIKRGGWDGQFAHRILFHARCTADHARCVEEKREISTAPLPFCLWPLWKTVMNIGGMFCRKYSDSASSKMGEACCFNSFVT